MFPADVFHDRRLYEATSGWLIEQGALKGQNPIGGFAWNVFHRAFRVLHHITAATAYAEMAAAQIVEATSGEVDSLDNVRVWSPLVETMIVEVVAAFADLRVLQNDTSMAILRASASRDIPGSFRDVANALKRAESRGSRPPRWLDQVPDSERRLLLEYWTPHGQRVAAYRDIDQHFGVLVHAGVFRAVSDSPRVKVLLPDNPEIKNEAGLTFASNVDGVKFIWDEFMRLHNLLERFASGRTSVRAPVPRLGLEFRPGLLIQPGEAKLHAVAVMNVEGSETALFSSTDDRRMTIRTIRRKQGVRSGATEQEEAKSVATRNPAPGCSDEQG